MRTAERKMELQLADQATGVRLSTKDALAFFAKGMRSIRNRIAVNRLSEMDDARLADIGVSRADVKDALDLGLLDDPALYLRHAARVHSSLRFTKLRQP